MDPVQKMGDVREIFISKHRNKGGRRYGFVRFKVVSDERSLERKLDNIIVGGLKMYINVPKYRRKKERYMERSVKHSTQAVGASNERKLPGQTAVQHRTDPKSYAKVVSTVNMDAGQRRNPLPTVR